MGILSRLALLLALSGAPLSAQQVRLAVPRLETSVPGSSVLAPLSLAAPSIAQAVPALSLSLRPALIPAFSAAPRVAAPAAPQTPVPVLGHWEAPSLRSAGTGTAPIGQLSGMARQIEGNNAPGRSPPAQGEPFRAAFDGQKLDHAPRLIIAGPPGAGKSTNAKRLAQEFGVVHIGVGDILRDYAKSDPAAAASMRRGELVDSGLVIGLVRARLRKEDVIKNGFILDGFPRRLAEAEAMKDVPIDAVIHLKVSVSELRRRLKARGRADDTDEALKTRLEVYREQTLPAIERLGRGAPVIAPRVAGTQDSVYARVRAAFLKILNP